MSTLDPMAYNRNAGFDDFSLKLIQALGIDFDSIPVPDSIWIRSDFSYLVIVTRSGGGNRIFYRKGNKYLRDNQFFISEKHDELGFSFSRFYYNIPKELKNNLKATYIEGSMIKTTRTKKDDLIVIRQEVI
jgi:hypothetical protein